MHCLQLVAAGAIAAMAFIPAMATKATATELRLGAELGQEAIAPRKSRTIYLRVGLEGLKPEGEGRRSPVNVAIVVDRSGSMQSEGKMARAREAAAMALGRLGPDDYASLVAYNHEVDVLMPSAHVTSQATVRRLIDELTASGNTALYAGTEEGIRQVRKFLARDRVNRVILVSDGLANVGPSSPSELAALGREAAGHGIAVTTIGLGDGYNEDLMQKLAYNSDGNHAFVASADDLVKVFNQEFGDVLSVVAQEIIIEIHCQGGFKPIRLLGREAEIDGSRVKVHLNQIYGAQEKYLVLEVEVPEGLPVGDADVAEVEVRYEGLVSRTEGRLSARVKARITDKAEEAEATLNKPVMADVAVQIATERNEEAVSLRDKGDIAGAKKVLEENAAYLKDAAGAFASPALGSLSSENERQAAEIDGDDDTWNVTRKAMRAGQHNAKVQQSY